MSEVQIHDIKLRHIDGKENPADFTTRPVSPLLLQKSNYFSGPNIKDLVTDTDEILISVSPVANNCSAVCTSVSDFEPIFDINKYSSYAKACRVMNYVFKFIQMKIYEKDPERYAHLYIANSYKKAQTYLIKCSQLEAFPKVFEFFNGQIIKCDPIVTQLNLYVDTFGIIRMKSKCRKLDSEVYIQSPILLSKNCQLTKSIIWDLHLKMRHAQVYKIIAALRQEFHVPKVYSTIKSIINSCIMCKRLYGRGLVSNTNAYPDFRINPNRRPFATIMIDTIGPYEILNNNTRVKMYIMIITCMFTRAINLVVCFGQTTQDFLLGLQSHVLEYGIMEVIISDNQPSFIAGMECISKILSSIEIKNFLKMHNIKPVSIEPYPSGASFLGGAVESLVKQVKNILYTSMSNKKVTLGHFYFLTAETKILVNKRIIGFKHVLTNPQECIDIPFAMTPEILLKGYEVPSFNILAMDNDTDDPTWSPNNYCTKDLFGYFHTLNNVRCKIQSWYESAFLLNLETQATNTSDRYKPKKQVSLHIGDVVALKVKLLKPFYYPLGVVTDIEYNDLNEVNAVSVRKANG